MIQVEKFLYRKIKNRFANFPARKFLPDKIKKMVLKNLKKQFLKTIFQKKRDKKIRYNEEKLHNRIYITTCLLNAFKQRIAHINDTMIINTWKTIKAVRIEINAILVPFTIIYEPLRKIRFIFKA